MTIIFKLLSDGAFVAGDTESGMTTYAYPTSTNAEAAKKHPERQSIYAQSMIDSQRRNNGIGADYDDANWQRLGGRPDTIKMDRAITLERHQNYGVFTYYPICDNAKRFADLTGTKTITPRAMQIIRSLGYVIIERQQEA
jgi:hypothetical protein